MYKLYDNYFFYQNQNHFLIAGGTDNISHY